MQSEAKIKMNWHAINLDSKNFNAREEKKKDRGIENLGGVDRRGKGMKCNVKECKKNHEINDASTLTPEEIGNLDTSIHHLLREGFAGASEDSTTIKEWYYPLTSAGTEARAQDLESEEDENYHCIQCDKEILEEEFLENIGLCNQCSRLTK